MAASINASTSAGVVTTADTSGNLNLQSNGTTIVALTSAGAAVTGTLSASGIITATTGVNFGGTTLSTYSAATYTGTFTGYTTTPTVTIAYVLVGQMVTFSSRADTSATSNSTAKSITGMPAAIYPPEQRNIPVNVIDNSGGGAWGVIQISAAGVMNCYPTADFNNWTASGVATVRRVSGSYVIN